MYLYLPRFVNEATGTVYSEIERPLKKIRIPYFPRGLIIGLKEFAEYCKVGIEDQTIGRHYWVDLTRVE